MNRNLHTRVARRPGKSPLDVYALVPGERYRVMRHAHRNLPLIQDVEPADPLAEMARTHMLPSGVVLKIMSRRDVRLGFFYRVSLDDGRIGYVNILALLGADVEKVMP